MAKFYKRSIPSKGVYPNGVYSDLYDNNKSTTDIASGNVSGIENTAFVIGDYTLPSRPTFGDAQMVGAKLGFYINSITQGGVGGTAGLKTFKLGVDIGGTEGGKSSAGSLINNQDIVQIASFHEEGANYISENFSNHDKSDDENEVMEMTLLKKIGPYIEEEVGYEKGQNYGLATGFGFGDAPCSATTHKKRFGQKQEDGSYIYKLKKKEQWATGGYASIKKHGNWWRRNHEWWKSYGATGKEDEFEISSKTIQNDVKYFQEVTVEIPPEDRPTAISSDNSFFDVIKNTETHRAVQDDSNTLKSEHFCRVVLDTKNVKTGGGAMKLDALYTHRNTAITSPQYGTFADPTKIVSGLPTSTEVEESTLQQVAFASKRLPATIDSGNSQTPMRAAAGTHSPVPTVELEMNFDKLASMLKRNERTAHDATIDDFKWRLNRSVCITFGALKPNNEDSLYTYAKRHLPLSGSEAATNGLGSGKPMQAAICLKADDGDEANGDNMAEKDYVLLTSEDGTRRYYVFCDSGESGPPPSTGTVLTASSDTGANTLGSSLANAGTCIAVTLNLTTLNELRTAITHANGHNGALLCGNSHGASNTVSFSANGNQYLHITQATGGVSGNSEGATGIRETHGWTGGAFNTTDFTADIGSDYTWVRSRDTSVSATTDFVGGYDISTFYGSAFFNIDGELHHKALEAYGTATAKEISFKCDDDLGEICLNSEPTMVGDGGLLAKYIKVAYQIHPEYPGARMCMYDSSSGDIYQKPHRVANCRSENLNMSSTGDYAYTSRLAVNRTHPPKYMTIWVNNYQAVKGGWHSGTKTWATGLKIHDGGSDDITSHDFYIDDPKTAEKTEGGYVKSQAWQLIKKYTSIRLQSSSGVTNAQAVTSIVKSAANADGLMELVIGQGKDPHDGGVLGYDNTNVIDEYITKPNVDTEVSVLVDSISLKKFNLLHHNATPASGNAFPERLNIPVTSNLQPFNFNLNLNNTNVDNIKDYTTMAPSYISLGFNNWYDMVGLNSENTKVMYADAKKFLMNGFQTALNSVGDKIIVNPDSRYSHVRAGYTSYEDRGMQCKNKLVQSVAQSLGSDDLAAGYQSNVTALERTNLNSLSQLFDNGGGTPTFTSTGLKVGDDAGTVGTNHDISIGANAAGQIDYFSQKGILEWKFSPRTTASGSTIANAGSGDLDSGDTNVTVSDGTHFKANQFIKATGGEIMKVTSISGNTLNLERGQYGTTAATHDYGQALNLVAAPEKRENIFCSARLLGIEGNTLEVDSLNVLKLNAGDEFIIYKYGDSHSSPTHTPIITKILRVLDDRKIIVDTNIDISQENITDYLISPYRYWLIVEIVNVGGEATKTVTSRASGNTQLTLSDVDGLKVYMQIKDTSITIESISGNVVTVSSDAGAISTVTFEGGTWQGNNKSYIRKHLPQKSYTNLVGISEKGTYGATLNESLFNDGANINSWLLEPFEQSEETAIVLKDYGHGGFNEENEIGGHAGYLPLNIQSDINKFKEVDISGVITTDSPNFGDSLTLITSTDDNEENFKINIDTETGTNPMYLLTELEDPLMDKPTLSVFPDKDNNFYPRFKWNQMNKDAWYGFLIIDDKNIENQYKNAIMHFPLDESGPHATAATTPSEKISGLTTIISGPLYDIEGLGGYSLNFDGTNDYIRCGTPNTNINTAATNDATATATSEMSIIAHIIPDSGASDDRYIVSQEETNGRKFSINLNSSNQIVAKVYRTDSDYVSLTSSSVVPTDGEIPTNVILTVDTTLMAGNIKLFVNGKLEDISGAALDTGTTNNWQKGATMQSANGYVVIGNSSHSSVTLDRAFDGKIEEVVIYDKCIYPIFATDIDFLFTKPLSELVSGQSLAQSKSNTAKLFIKDYHNIRGSSENEVASSSQVSWRKAGFALDTS